MELFNFSNGKERVLEIYNLLYKLYLMKDENKKKSKYLKPLL
jgi:hypothetical protein